MQPPTGRLLLQAETDDPNASDENDTPVDLYREVGQPYKKCFCFSFDLHWITDFPITFFCLHSTGTITITFQRSYTVLFDCHIVIRSDQNPPLRA